MDLQLLCTICNKILDNEIDDISIVQEIGLQTLIKISQEKSDDKWKQWVQKKKFCFHGHCKLSYSVLSTTTQTQLLTSCYSSSIEPPFNLPLDQSKLSLPCPSTSFTEPTQISFTHPVLTSCTDHSNNFNFKSLCFICEKKWDRRHKTGFRVTLDSIRDRLMTVAKNRNDFLGKTVLNRLLVIPSLTEVQARYHNKCYKDFFSPATAKNKPKDTEENLTFQKVCNLIESTHNYKFRLSILRQAMGETPIDTRTLFRKLKKKYGEDIFVLQHSGRESVVYYKTFNLAKVCSDWFCFSESFSELQENTIITVAAEILQAKIKKHDYQKKYYPLPNKFLDRVVTDIPPLLTTFLHNLLSTGDTIDDSNHLKVDNIAHSIVSTLRPRSFISCLQLALGTYIHRKTGSKLILSILSKLGICYSYHNIRMLEASTIIANPKTTVTNAFVQFVFDNTDHNVNTLDGHETFHCLGGIAVYTPGTGITCENRPVKYKNMPSIEVLASQTRIPDVPYSDLKSPGLALIDYKSTKKLQLGIHPIISPSYSTYLWSKHFNIPGIPSWRGYMEIISQNVEYAVSHVTCLPFINRPPSQYSTINSALHFAVSETRKLNQKTTFVTFDQPLYQKARNIVAQLQHKDFKDVIVRLGGFHLLMSFLGAIGNFMAESGLEGLWSTAYAPESVKKMLSGHAFSRAVRAHILTFTALGVTVCKNIYGNENYKKRIQLVFKDWHTNPPSLQSCNRDEVLIRMRDHFIMKMMHLENNGPTAKLWVQYFRYILVVLEFIEAERLGNWKLHLQSIEKMLPIFHATGHFAYAKSAHIYLQDMANLELTMDPEEWENYTEKGYFTIRRSDKAWAGIWSDMTIEQTLNRFFGTDLKHGRGITPTVVARYLLAMPSAFNIMDCLETYCNLESASSEQHVDLCQSRMIRDENDLQKFIFWLDNHKPFAARSVLMSLSSGVIGGSHINCYQAFEKGQQGINSMIGKNAENVSLSRVNQVKTLAAARNEIHITKFDFDSVDPTLLFQRISVEMHRNERLARRALKYELSPFPLSLFDENGMMRKNQKSILYKNFDSFKPNDGFYKKCIFVLDGGWLLHQVHWPHGKRYRDICQLYLIFIKKKFDNVCIVFDGYGSEDVGTKSYERYRRREKNVAVDLEISLDAMLALNKKKFLSNIANKLKFIDLLYQYLKTEKIPVKLASGDADRLIVTTGIEINQNSSCNVVVVGNDIDLLVLLIALTPQEETMYFQKMAGGKKQNTLFSTYLNQNLSPFILFAHAFAGCDTTSAFFNKGKNKIIALLQRQPTLQQAVQVFNNLESKLNELYETGEKLVLELYQTDLQKQKKNEILSINELRYRIYASSLGQFKKETCLASLPPTPSVLLEHIKRVFYQIQEWQGNQLNLVEWGWRKTNFHIVLPIMNSLPPAPPDLLLKISCGCVKNCSTCRCGCKKQGLRCNKMCKNCNGENCGNRSVEIDTIERDEDSAQANTEERDEEEYVSSEPVLNGEEDRVSEADSDSITGSEIVENREISMDVEEEDTEDWNLYTSDIDHAEESMDIDYEEF